MRDEDLDADVRGRIDAACRHARQQMRDAGTIRTGIEARIARATMHRSRRLFVAAAAAAACIGLLAVGGPLSWRATTSQHTAPVAESTPPPANVDFQLQVGDTELVQHLATVVDGGAVVVVWSYRGHGISPNDAAKRDGRAGKYRAVMLRDRIAADGRTVVCSVFFPDAGVVPGLEPPGVRVRSADDGRSIAFAAAPRAASRDELAAAARAAGATDVEDVLRAARAQLN